MLTVCDKNNLLLKEKNDNNNGIEVVHSVKRKDGASLSIWNFFVGWLLHYLLYCLYLLFLEANIFLWLQKLLYVKIKSVVICIIIKDLNGVFILNKMLVTIDFKGFLDGFAIGWCCSNYLQPKQGIFYVHK